MPYRQLDHTADLCFEVTADSFAALCAEALRVMTAWLGPVWGSAKAERSFRIEAPDRTALLVDLLNEALTLSQIHREAYDLLVIRSISDKFIEGSFVGKSITGARDEIKAVTYHGATVEERADRSWVAILLMDI